MRTGPGTETWNGQFIFGQDEQIHENVVVVNVEVIARILEKGRPFGGFKKSDFNLYEDGERVGQAVIEVAKREDIYYLLTYSPKDKKKSERNLRLETNRPGLKVAFAHRVDVQEAFPLASGLNDVKTGI